MTAAGHDAVLAGLLAAARDAVPGLTVDRTDDPAVALLDAWATVADVVAFYQDRIAAEGYLRTAGERLSVIELVRALGYRAAPAGSASTLLAFTVEDSVDPAATVTVPAGTAVQSVPGQGEQPQTFETSADLTAYAVRNAMRLRLRRPARIGPGSLRLAADQSGLRPGDLVLLRFAGGPSVRVLVRVLSSVRPVPAGPDGPATTVIGWDEPVTPPAGTGEPVAYALRQCAAVFGHNAPDWRLLPANAQQAYGTSDRQWPGFALPDPAPGQDAVLDLDALHPEIQPGWWLVVRGSGPDDPDSADPDPADPEPAIFQVTGAGPVGRADFGLTATVTRVRLRGAGRLSAFDRRGAVVYAGAADPLTAAGEPVTEPVTGPVLRLDQPVALESGTPLVVTGTDGTGGQVSQVAVVASASAADGGTLLTLTGALDTPLDPASVVVLGNVVVAGHGRTVAGEVLGSGDGTVGYQRFTLRHNHVSTASGGTGDSLTVRVDGVRWTQRPTLYGLGPADRAYATWIDDGGTATVLFGDGTAGARLPTGTENVIADYRSGSGPDGNVRAGTLTLLLNRPLGIRSVDNPVPATGGTPPEPADTARTTAPRSVQTFDRVVSLADHEEFATAFPGIAKATAVAFAAGRAPYVHLTVAGPDGAPVPATTVAALRPALDAAGRWGPPPVVANCRRLGFTVGVTVTAGPDRASGSVAGAVRAALVDAFSFERRSFAEPVAASQVVAVVQAVPGVCSALLTVLALSPAPDPAAGPVAEILTARPARPASGGVLPAEILVVDADRITVTEVPR